MIYIFYLSVCNFRCTFHFGHAAAGCAGCRCEYVWRSTVFGSVYSVQCAVCAPAPPPTRPYQALSQIIIFFGIQNSRERKPNILLLREFCDKRKFMWKILPLMAKQSISGKPICVPGWVDVDGGGRGQRGAFLRVHVWKYVHDRPGNGVRKL